jgi:hypothetical protein
MRTTVELPPDLMRAAKARSAERGESLKSLLTRAVAAELETPSFRQGQRTRVRLPLFGRPEQPPVQLSNADLERALAAADASAASRQPRRSRGKRR